MLSAVQNRRETKVEGINPAGNKEYCAILAEESRIAGVGVS